MLCRPLVHLFGHAHQGAQAQLIDGVLFSNASTMLGFVPAWRSQHNHAVVIDIHLPDKSTTQPDDVTNSKCVTS